MNIQKLKEENDIYLKEIKRLNDKRICKEHKLHHIKGRLHKKYSYSLQCYRKVLVQELHSIIEEIGFLTSEIKRNNFLLNNGTRKPVGYQDWEVRIIRAPKAKKEVYDRQSECKSRKLGNYNKSVRDCLLRANGYCELTGVKSDNLQVHHIFSYNKYPNKRCQVSNLVAIDEKVHKYFHKIYGYGDNTLSQWNRFKKNHYEEIVKIITN